MPTDIVYGANFVSHTHGSLGAEALPKFPQSPSLAPTLPLAPAGHPRQVSRQGHAHFSFTAFEPLKVKGYTEPVVFYHPQQSGRVAKARHTP